MHVPWGLWAYALWLAVLAASCVVAGLLLARHGWRKAGWGAVTVLGALLMWAWVSAVIGVLELTNYPTHAGFFISCGMGALGVALFGMGCRRLRR